MYYLRSRPAADPIKFTLDVEALLKDGGKLDVSSHVESDLKRKPSEVDKENLDQTEKKIKTEKIDKTKKLKTIPLDQYQEEECFNCGS